MTDEQLNNIVSERSRAMAIIRLTRRSDVGFHDTKKITGLDLQVYIELADKRTAPEFGILLQGVPSPTSLANANKVLQPTVKSFQRLGKFTYPVCLFFFTMADDKGYFSWLAEPIFGDDGPELLHHEKASCVDLTDEKLQEVVEHVVAWYAEVESLRIA